MARWRVVELVHPIPSFLTTLAAIGCALIFGLTLGDRRLWWIAAIMLAAQFSISALNEWADADLDARSSRLRPIPLGLASRRTAAVVAAIGALAALLMSTLSGFGLVAFLVVILGLAAGSAYDVALKRTPLSFLPFAIGFPLLPLWVGLVAHRPASSLLAIVAGAVPLAIGIHLADAIPDRDGDRDSGVQTLAVFLGRPAAEVVAAVLVGIGSAVAIALILRRFGNGFSGLSLVAFALAYIAFTLPTQKTPERWRLMFGKWILIGDALVVGLILVAVA
jgi:4-hydroxybenzoate polyprenyltransferase